VPNCLDGRGSASFRRSNLRPNRATRLYCLFFLQAPVSRHIFGVVYNGKARGGNSPDRRCRIKAVEADTQAVVAKDRFITGQTRSEIMRGPYLDVLITNQTEIGNVERKRGSRTHRTDR
jgi:hypothetical protein